MVGNEKIEDFQDFSWLEKVQILNMESSTYKCITSIIDGIDAIGAKHNISKKNTRCFFLCCLPFLIISFCAIVAGIYCGVTFYSYHEDEGINQPMELQIKRMFTDEIINPIINYTFELIINITL